LAAQAKSCSCGRLRTAWEKIHVQKNCTILELRITFRCCSPTSCCSTTTAVELQLLRSKCYMIAELQGHPDHCSSSSNRHAILHWFAINPEVAETNLTNTISKVAVMIQYNASTGQSASSSCKAVNVLDKQVLHLACITQLTKCSVLPPSSKTTHKLPEIQLHQ
jgi:hypothetical protein